MVVSPQAKVMVVGGRVCQQPQSIVVPHSVRCEQHKAVMLNRHGDMELPFPPMAGSFSRLRGQFCKMLLSIGCSAQESLFDGSIGCGAQTHGERIAQSGVGLG